MSESFDSEDDKKKEDPQDRWARELKMRLEHEHKMKIDGLRHETFSNNIPNSITFVKKVFD